MNFLFSKKKYPIHVYNVISQASPRYHLFDSLIIVLCFYGCYNHTHIVATYATYMIMGASLLNGSYDGESSGSSPCKFQISQSQYIHATFPWLCKKEDYWVVWILNSHVHDIITTLIPSLITESVIHYCD